MAGKGRDEILPDQGARHRDHARTKNEELVELCEEFEAAIAVEVQERDCLSNKPVPPSLVFPTWYEIDDGRRVSGTGPTSLIETVT